MVRDEPKKTKSNGGFTLIELVIVIGVVAMLAAISVPNYLEAQVRANIGKAKADMKTLVIGLESYYVDHNVYPRPSDADGNFLADLATPHDAFEGRVPPVLTSPVVYLSHLMVDPFIPFKSKENKLYIYSTRPAFEAWEEEGEFDEFVAAQVTTRTAPSVEYYVVSRGPDRDHEELPGNNLTSAVDGGDDLSGPALYDPSNGSVSNGDILYFGPTVGFEN